MKKLFAFIQGIFLYLLLASPVFAQRTVDPCQTDVKLNPIGLVLCNLGSGNLGSVIGFIVIAIIVIAVIIALLYLLYGAVRWIMSRGEKEQVEAARNHIIAAIVGLIVIFLAIFVIAIVLGFFNLELTNLVLPKINP